MPPGQIHDLAGRGLGTGGREVSAEGTGSHDGDTDTSDNPIKAQHAFPPKKVCAHMTHKILSAIQSSS